MQVYLNNPNLKAAGVELQFEPWQVEEIIKCYNDPIYFAEKYVKIVTLDHGLVNFKPHPFQRDLILHILKNRKTITLAGRQIGKCCHHDTLITIRKKGSNEPVTMKMGDFYEWNRYREAARSILAGNTLQQED